MSSARHAGACPKFNDFGKTVRGSGVGDRVRKSLAQGPPAQFPEIEPYAAVDFDARSILSRNHLTSSPKPIS